MKILVIDDEHAARYALCKALRGEGRTLLEADDGEQALAMVRQHQPDLVFLDLNIPKLDGQAVLRRLAHSQPQSLPEIIVVTANDSIHNAVECIRLGAADFLAKPYEVERVRSIANRAEKRVRLEDQVASLQHQVGQSGGGPIIGSSRAMRGLLAQIDRAAKVDLPVLIRGESGTGKELVARQLHAQSRRSQGPFVAVNTAAISASLIESELFGHVKGAFTGAERPREGVFRQADGGTLFLDEIGDMPVGVQTRLLRVLQEGIVQPVGSEQNVAVDVRVLSATHQDLESAIAQKSFRQDLYFRLRGIELLLPPLRNRQEDILLLANGFMGSGHSFDRSAVAAMVAYEWPGNVRELKQRVEAAAAMAQTNRIKAADLGLAPTSSQPEVGGFDDYLALPLSEGRERLVEDFERASIGKAIREAAGNISAAARQLGIHRQSLQQKMAKLGISVERALG
ncbi:MAG: sigma-54-dependent transcriptional regulator [Planctomycetaceae bacterium]